MNQLFRVIFYHFGGIRIIKSTITKKIEHIWVILVRKKSVFSSCPIIISIGILYSTVFLKA